MDKLMNLEHIRQQYSKILEETCGKYISSGLVDYFVSSNLFNHASTPNFFPRIVGKMYIQGELYIEFSFSTSITRSILQLIFDMEKDLHLKIHRMESDEHDGITVLFRWL